MSITLNHSDFQCLQDQLVDLKSKNYELTEKNRRGQLDFEAAKAKIWSLQLKLEEQERDFQVTSSTLRREIEVAYGNISDESRDNSGKENEDDAKIEELLHRYSELQQRYEESAEIVQQMDLQINTLSEKLNKSDEENTKLQKELEELQSQLKVSEDDCASKLKSAIQECKENAEKQCSEYISNISAITIERDDLQKDVQRLADEVKQLNLKLESQIEERKIHERRGLQIVKELKRQLALEKNRSETLQKRIEGLLSATGPVSNSELESRGRISNSSSTNSRANSSSNGNDSRANQDANSVSSWSLVPGKQMKSSNQALCETLSICSIDSEDRETVQKPCDTRSESSLQRLTSSSNASGPDLLPQYKLNSPSKQISTPSQSLNDGLSQNLSSSQFNDSNVSGCMSIEDQAALMERLTNLQHDKWNLEEKLSYLEQANASLNEDLANKSNIIKNYFMDQAVRATVSNHHDSASAFGVVQKNSDSRRTSFPNNVNHLLSEKPSLKKVVDFLKERSQISSVESENISREATRKMQLMLEETLIKCLQLQKNLDYVTSELNKLQR